MQFKQLPTGAGDTLTIEAIYGKGATAYVISGTNPTSFYMYGGAKSGNALGSIAFGNVTDGIFGWTSPRTPRLQCAVHADWRRDQPDQRLGVPWRLHAQLDSAVADQHLRIVDTGQL